MVRNLLSTLSQWYWLRTPTFTLRNGKRLRQLRAFDRDVGAGLADKGGSNAMRPGRSVEAVPGWSKTVTRAND